MSTELNRGAHTYSEITSQPNIWQDAISAFHQQSGALKTLWEQGDFDTVLFTGCGSTYYLAHTSAALFQQLTGISARAYPASEIVLFADMVFSAQQKALLVTVSRSGETTETVEAVRVYRQRGGTAMVTVTCGSSSTLAQQADLVFAIDAAQETSLAQTRSFASMLIVTQAIAAFLAGESSAVLDQLPAVASRLLTEYHDLARQLGEDPAIQRFFFLGSGELYGIASEGMLKMKEMSLSYSEAFHMLEFRHGPMSMVDGSALIIGLLSEGAFAQEAAVLRQMRARGAQILALSEGGMTNIDGAHEVSLGSGVPRWARPVAYLPVMQLMAYYRAMSNGQNPDQPANLTFVISLDDSMT